MTTSGSRSALGRAGWYGPVLVAVTIIAVAWWVWDGVHDALQERLEDELEALLASQSEAAACALSGAADRAAVLAALSRAGISGETGETQFFDEQGRLLAPSRFEGRLQAAGVFGTTLGLGLRDPGGDLLAGYRPTLARPSLPLTRAAGSAVSGHSGAEMAGYPSYRGVPVVGAWRWLPEHELGVAVEMETQEAYRPSDLLLKAFWLLAAAAGAAGAAAALIARRNTVLLRQVRDAERMARKLGQYTLVKKIGEGGMGEVYLASHAMLRRPTAIKLLRADRTSENAIGRFEREVQQTSRLTHPNTVQIFDFGRTPGGTFYYAMEYLVGVPLDEFLEVEGPLEEGRVIFILQQVCASLNEAHGLGLVHRDIKPENIALCRAGGAFDVAKVLDFGLVMDQDSGDDTRLSTDGAIVGTPRYMAPEAFLAPETVDKRSDIYSLGAVGYFLLTGHAPFEGKTVMELFNQQTRVKPVPPSERADRAILPDLERAVLACLEKDPASRPKSANAFSRELEWCRSFGEWNRDKARYWWRENERRLEERWLLSTKANLSPGGVGQTTMEIKLDDR